MEQWVFRHAAHAIAGNEEARAVLLRKGYGGPITVLPQFGVDEQHFLQRPRTPQQASPLVVGYAGRLVEEKGVHLLLEALSGLDTVGAWRCEVRGSGPAQAALEAQAAALGIQAKVAFHPPLPSTAMADFYQAVDILVLPSLTRPHWKEQFGRVLIEAMASGSVVVGSDSGEIPQVIGSAGLVVPEGDAVALRHALRLLLTDAPLRRGLAQAGRERVIAHFTQRAIARRTAEVYRTVMSVA